jgi:negative regulator of flagellin synthesis FlgM
MVSPISSSGTGAVDSQRLVNLGAAKPVARTLKNPASVCDATPAARLRALGPPIDTNRVEEIRAAIANGNYTVDADRLAAAMIALDLPASGQ